MSHKILTDEQLIKFNNCIDNDQFLPQSCKDNPIIRDLCRSGLWLCEQLEKLKCPEELIVRIQYSAGKASFGHDCWDVHQQFLDGYVNNQLDFETENSELN